MAAGNEGRGGVKDEAQILMRLWLGAVGGGYAIHQYQTHQQEAGLGWQEAEEIGCGLNKLDVGA